MGLKKNSADTCIKRKTTKSIKEEALFLFIIPTDYNANAPVIERARKVAVVERWLQDARRKHDLVFVAAVVRIHYRRSRVPEGFVYRLAKAEIVMDLVQS